MNTAEKIYELVQHLPTFRQMEVLDFAHFIALRERPTPNNKTSFQHFSGALKESAAFAGDPVVTQKAMRDEWN